MEEFEGVFVDSGDKEARRIYLNPLYVRYNNMKWIGNRGRYDVLVSPPVHTFRFFLFFSFLPVFFWFSGLKER
jgi:hypothetical protein